MAEYRVSLLAVYRGVDSAIILDGNAGSAVDQHGDAPDIRVVVIDDGWSESADGFPARIAVDRHLAQCRFLGERVGRVVHVDSGVVGRVADVQRAPDALDAAVVADVHRVPAVTDQAGGDAGGQHVDGVAAAAGRDRDLGGVGVLEV